MVALRDEVQGLHHLVSNLKKDIVAANTKHDALMRSLSAAAVAPTMPPVASKVDTVAGTATIGGIGIGTRAIAGGMPAVVGRGTADVADRVTVAPVVAPVAPAALGIYVPLASCQPPKL